MHAQPTIFSCQFLTAPRARRFLILSAGPTVLVQSKGPTYRNTFPRPVARRPDSELIIPSNCHNLCSAKVPVWIEQTASQYAHRLSTIPVRHGQSAFHPSIFKWRRWAGSAALVKVVHFREDKKHQACFASQTYYPKFSINYRLWMVELTPLLVWPSSNLVFSKRFA